MIADAWHFIAEPFTYGFMQRALLMALMIGTVCAVFSCFLILKGWSLMGDAVSHAILPGLGLAYVLGLPLGVGAFAAGLGCALLTGYVRENSRVKEDAVMGIVFSGMFAAGLVMLTRIQTDIHLMHVLFGNVLGLSARDLWQTGLLAGAVTAVMLAWRRDIMLYCFDPGHAAALGLRVRVIHFGLLALLALTVVAALQAAGVILVIAMLIAPGAAGYLWARSFDRMMAIAVAVSVFSCVAGTIVSYHIDAATAPAIIAIQAAICAVAMATGRKGEEAAHG
jgi:manganese/iron transport system permease protein